MTQTLAILLDAYRELNSRKLFWITLIISGLVVLSFALIGINENGLRVIAWDVAIPGLNSQVIKPATFYKSLFANLGVGVWLGLAATILALVSTAGIIPDFISAGSIDLMLSKPMGRLRLFLTKYLSGLLFVALQVGVFSLASFFVLGFRGGTWEPALFLAVPVITIFYSYLFSICVLLGMLTRSTIASLLITMLAWFFIFAVGISENAIMTAKLATQSESAAATRAIQRNQKAIDRLKERGDEIDFDAASAPLRTLMTQDQETLDRNVVTESRLQTAHSIMMGVKTVLPKTTETVDLLERWLIDMAELPSKPEDIIDDQPERRGRDNRIRVDMDEVQRDAMEELRGRAVWWVMGTSLLFEAFVLAIAGWIFCRRDF